MKRNKPANKGHRIVDKSIERELSVRHPQKGNCKTGEFAEILTDRDHQIRELLKQYGVFERDRAALLRALKTISGNCEPLTKTEINVVVQNVFQDFIVNFDDEAQALANNEWRERVGNALLNIAYGVLGNAIFWLILYYSSQVASHASAKVHDSTRSLITKMNRLRSRMIEGLSSSDRKILDDSVTLQFSERFLSEYKQKLKTDKVIQTFLHDLHSDTCQRGTQFWGPPAYDRWIFGALIQFLMQGTQEHIHDLNG
jgi:hypothetical protein